MYSVDTDALEELVVKKLIEAGKIIAIAESCTGGLLSKRITDVNGSSKVFETGIVAYANSTKEKLLNVNHETLLKYGAVSKETAIEMAEGMLKLSGADIAVAVTGIAGPGGGTKQKPVGLTYIALADGQKTYVSVKKPTTIAKDRDWHRNNSSSQALDIVRRYLDNLPIE